MTERKEEDRNAERELKYRGIRKLTQVLQLPKEATKQYEKLNDMSIEF